MAAGKDVMTFPPVGRMVYPTAPLQFSGTQYNAGHVVGYVQVAAAAKIDVRIWLIESAMPTGEQPVSAVPLQSVTSQNIPGVVSIKPLISGRTVLRSGGRTGQIRRGR